MKCPLCGYEFSKEDMKCRGCPMAIGKCKLLCCPNCNYQFVEESKIVNFFTKKILHLRKQVRKPYAPALARAKFSDVKRKAFRWRA